MTVTRRTLRAGAFSRGMVLALWALPLIAGQGDIVPVEIRIETGARTRTAIYPRRKSCAAATVAERGEASGDVRDLTREAA